MNTIKQLLDKYCPDGVEYKKLGEIADCYSGATPNTKTKEYWENGNIPWMSSGEVNHAIVYATEKKITKLGFDSCSTKMVPANTVVVALAGQGKTRGTVALTKIPLCTNQSLCSIVLKGALDSSFLFHYLRGQYDKLRRISSGDGTRGGLNLKMINSFEVPVPPLPIQREIVRILDSFTSLEAELEAELEARRKQYEYYRDQLLSFKHLSGGGKNKVEWMTLGEMGTFIRGNGLQKKDFTDNGFPCIHYGQIHTTYNTFTDKTVSYTSFEKAKHLKKAHKGDLLIATTSEDVDACCKAVAWLGESQCAISGDSYIYHHNQDPKYIAYLFQTDMFAKQKKTAATGTKVIRVSGDAMAKFKFPIPPLSTQRRIVSILDRFESLVNDISTGLPAEIAARHQQYEYYRDQLLSFKRK